MAGHAPASRIEAFDVLAPAGTPKAAPVEIATAWLPGELVAVSIVIPDGHNGLTGLRLALAHSPVIPRTQGAWLVGNDDTIAFDTIGYPDSGAWSAFVYNTDLFDHTFHVRFEVSDFPFSATPAQVPPIPLPAIV